MQVKWTQNLGSDDARAMNKACNCNIDYKRCTIGAVVDIPDEAAAFLAKKYNAIFETVSKVKGEAKNAEITGPAK